MILTDEYRDWLADLNEKKHSEQINALLQVNDTLLRLYWDMGGNIAVQRKEAKLGSGFFKQLRCDFKREFSDMKGFQSRLLDSSNDFICSIPMDWKFANICWRIDRI